MTSKMLIDSAHPEETRVVVLRGNRVEEFDFESASRRQLRGNIYLAKVTRVEPSLQAAFVEFGGNRHGFLAFSEIHPDYYQIPTADRLALLEAEQQAARDADFDDEEGRGGRRQRRAKPKRSSRGPRVSSTGAEAELTEDEAGLETQTEGETEVEADAAHRDAHAEVHSADEADAAGDLGREAPANAEPNEENGREGADGADEVIEQLGGADAMEEVPLRAAPRHRRQYKIQEVIKRRQILLVQVVKEERGTKGAALTTYLSLAGRYSVLMPNTARGGGISRKITNTTDRKRLKSVAEELEVPEGMGVILRTAGASRTKTEIKRDFEYLLRLWESVRELTLNSTAPALVYEEGSLIKRAIRDLYSKDIEEIQVAGDEGYREAKDFMRMLMPSHAKVVQPYRESQPIFTRNGVEAQLDAMFSNVVTLRSGGYIVVNQTEALVAIDVNSGRATREHNIEDTALKTNLEAAEEVARQLRLRDLAGLIVIDFIDMEEKRNNKAVERKLNDCLKNDRARIQVGRISHFGLLEMSRQRIRTGVLESSTSPCPHCAGTGLLRSTPSIALHVLRALEDMLMKSATHDIIVRTRLDIAFYILNQKRDTLRAIEERFGVHITIKADEDLTAGQHYLIERGELATPKPVEAKPVIGAASVEPIDVIAEPEEIEDEDENAPEAETAESGESAERKRRRRRRRRGGRGAETREMDAADDGAEPRHAETGLGADMIDDGRSADPLGSEAETAETAESDEGGEDRPRRRRRRGGRRQRRDEAGNEGAAMSDAAEDGDERSSRTSRLGDLEITFEPAPNTAEPAAVPGLDLPSIAEDVDVPTLATPEPVPPAPEPEPEPEPDPNRPKRSGWWSRAKQAIGG